MGAQQEGGQDTTEITWTIQARGSRRFLHRVLFAIADINQPSWRLLYAVIPISLLVTAVLVHGSLVYVYQMYCAVAILMLTQFSLRFINMTVAIDEQARTVFATYHVDDSLKKTEEVDISLEKIKTANFHSLASETLVELHPKKLLYPWITVLVPSDAESQLRSSLQRHNISIREEDYEEFPNWLWGRIALTVFTLGVAPLVILLTQPLVYSWGIILVLLFQFVLFLKQGW